MNPQAHRLIFNPHRGQLMAVAETASAQGKSASGESSSTGAAAVVACIALAFSLLQTLPPPSQAASFLSDLASIQPIALITPAMTAIYSGVPILLQTTSSFSQKTESGLLSGGGFGISYGHRDLSQDAGNTTTTNAASTVGSVGGNVTLSGKNYVQTGSDVSTPKGDITINAQNVAITEARESSNSQTQTKFSQSGITVAISNPVVGAVQSADQLRQAASKTSDARMQALAAASATLGAKSAVTDKDGKFDADKASSVSVSVSLGQSKSQSSSTTTADTAAASTLTAGGNITINAKTVNGGALANPADSNITLQGVQIKAGDAVTLDADNRVNVLAAKNTQTQSSTNSSSSASVGVAIQYGAKGTGYGFTAAASAARGSSDGTDTTYTNSHISAGNQVNITSGGDTTIKGGVVTANTVKANVGGDLKVESLQDTSVFTGKQSSAGGSVMIGAGGGGSVSASKTAINSNFASVAEQSGIRAGDGGFQVSTKGDTTLTGGAITSTQTAIDKGANSLSTAKLTTSDVQNTASYSANSVGGTLGTGGLSTSSGAGLGQKSGEASSTTAAAISGLAGNTSARTGDKETGIAAIFDKTAVQDDVNAQVLITTKTGQQASREVATYADGKATDLRNQAEQAGKELDPAKQQDLLAQAKTWDEGGSNRVALHAGVGLVTGGAAGAAGAATVASAAPMLNEVQANVASKLETAGLNKTLAANIAQGVTGAGVLGVGAATGSAGAAVAGFNGDTNNRQLHPTERQLIAGKAKELAKQTCVNGDANCLSATEKYWSDQLTETAQASVDSKLAQSRQSYLNSVAATANTPGSEGAVTGRASQYLKDEQTAKTILGQMAGQPILGTDGQPITADGSKLTLFSATQAQAQDHSLYAQRPAAYDTRVSTNGSADNVVPAASVLAVNARDTTRLTNLSAQNGTTTPDTTLEQVLFGGGAQAGKAAGKAIVEVVESRVAASAAQKVEAGAIASAKVENNIRADDAQQYINNTAPKDVPQTVVRQDNNFYATTNEKGALKPVINEKGDLVSPNPDGTGSIQSQVRGGNSKNSALISTTDPVVAVEPKTYGSTQIDINARDLQRDVNSGNAAQNIKVIPPEVVQAELTVKVDAAQVAYDRNPTKDNSDTLIRAQKDLANAIRDGECLIKGCVPAPYFSPPTVAPIRPKGGQ